MAGDTRRHKARQRLQQQVRDRDQPPVLLLRERPIIATFQFDADRKVVAALATFKARHAGMPGPRMQRHILRQTTPTVDQQMRGRSEEHTSELQLLMRISYAVFCLKKKKKYTKFHIQYCKE